MSFTTQQITSLSEPKPLLRIAFSLLMPIHLDSGILSITILNWTRRNLRKATKPEKRKRLPRLLPRSTSLDKRIESSTKKLLISSILVDSMLALLLVQVSLVVAMATSSKERSLSFTRRKWRRRRRERARNEQHAFFILSVLFELCQLTHEDIWKALRNTLPIKEQKCANALKWFHEECVLKKVYWWGSFRNIFYLLYVLLFMVMQHFKSMYLNS